ncbi:MAG TPA: 16S rRNA (cytidine(1402)-2'-O)-methyltransferase, partial [Candidatus Kapabacteria bacterium]|nr:16S rRNA (cytidine(1402)-2'-O)-methyltransferase [Candidatus Kapabacteria bacterium]
MENNNITKKFGKLYIVSTPIGNKDDISLRAIKVLQSCDIVVCEEEKIGARLLHNYNINKPLEILNEHNEAEKSFELIKLLKEGKHLALTSDCGTPLFADPGILLVNQAIQNNIELHSIPGASSIMAGLVLSGFTVDRFLFAGFLSRINDSRINQIKSLSKETKTVVILETPYRIMPVLQAFADIIPYRKAYIGCNLTLPFETNHYGNFKELYEKFRDLKFKGEFIIIFEKVLRKISKDKSSNYDEDNFIIEENSESSKDDNREFKRDDKRKFNRDDKPAFRRDDKRKFNRDDKPAFRRD